MVRQPAVANQFYPGSEQGLNKEISARMKEGQE
jgi:predicted class III extradiol MEMO1 family dioxygenase